ncbi:MAG TPA: HEAT repeat domain-containing protein [Vicinamibacterales bacterium]|jgi:HEAT repeat protein/cyclophilin family peptidyl-prolyl cis-trans isomerase|nr:HEAT repeat domain-containing protein [Vicinamibacterales bacterium]
MRTLVALTIAVGACACAPAVKPQVTPAPVQPSVPPSPPFEVKQAWILRLEDLRVLREAGVDNAAGDAQPLVPDLIALLKDDEARVRRRAALAIGRVGLRDGTPALVSLLTDGDEEVRQMAAFALGLIGDPAARDPLVTALSDPSPMVKSSAAEALGLIGDASSADAVARMARDVFSSGGVTEAALAGTTDDDRATPAAAFRFALFSLVRLKAYPALASVVIDDSGAPRIHAWPVAFALQRLENPQALPALRVLAADSDPTTRAFAVKGLGALKDRESVAPLVELITTGDRSSAVEAIRALGRIGSRDALPAMLKFLTNPKSDPFLRLEAIAALGTIGGDGVFDMLLDALVDPNPAVRAAVLRALAQVDPAGFTIVLGSLDADPNFSVRAALATVLGTLPSEAVAPRLRVMLKDTDARVIPSVVTALAKIKAPDAGQIALERLSSDDVIVRAAAAAALGELKPAGGETALAEAYRRGESDAPYNARAAALTALAAYGPDAARPVLTAAFKDKDWAVRLRAAALMKEIDPRIDAAHAIRPAPTMLNAEAYAAEHLIAPKFSTEAYIETERGIIKVGLAVIDAPLTVENFVTLANKGFFNGLSIHRVVPDFVIQAGDPRADSEGGPGYTIRDELSERAFLRGTVGMALDWADTGGSQFFITHSPQPHLDARYTVFGRVLSGMDVVDQIQQGDVIRQIKIWDGN